MHADLFNQTCFRNEGRKNHVGLSLDKFSTLAKMRTNLQKCLVLQDIHSKGLFGSVFPMKANLSACPQNERSR